MSKLKQFLPQKQSFFSVVRPRKSQSEKNDYLLLSSQSDEEDDKSKISIFKNKSEKKKKNSTKKSKEDDEMKKEKKNSDFSNQIENYENNNDVNKNYDVKINEEKNDKTKKTFDYKIFKDNKNEKCKIGGNFVKNDEKKEEKIIYENFNQNVYTYVNETNSIKNSNENNKQDKSTKIPETLIKKIETTYTEIPINNFNNVENRRRKNNQSFDTLIDRIEFINSKSKIKNEKKLERNNYKSENNLLHKIPPVPRSMKVLKNEELNLLSKLEVSQNEFNRKIFSNQKFYSRNPIYVSMYELNQDNCSKNSKNFNNSIKNSLNKSTKNLNESINYDEQSNYLTPRPYKLKVMNYQDNNDDCEKNLKSLRELKPKQISQINDEKLSQLTYTYLDFDSDKNLENMKKVNKNIVTNSGKGIQYSKIDFLASNSLKKVKEFRTKNRYFQE